MSDTRSMPSNVRVSVVTIVVVSVALLPGCPGVHVAGDTGESADAGRDTPAGDAWGPDAADGAFRFDAGTDAFAPPDAWRAAEVCNGVDEDDDELVDEGADVDCRSAAGARDAVCVTGTCQCRAEGTLPHTGVFADCNADWADGCETPLDSPTSCGGCGVVCDAVSECTDTEVGGLRCRPMRILDFSVSRRDGEISCVVAFDGRVLCRGPNTEHAISDVESESSVLDWTVVDMPAAREVRANLRARDDGTDVLSICVITTEGDVVCRGDNGTGLLGYGDRVARSGNHTILLPESVYRVEIRGGDAYAMFGTDTTRATLWRWGGPEAIVPRLWLEQVYDFELANMPIATNFGPRPGPPGLPPAGDMMSSWGAHHDRLANQEDGAPPWNEPTAFLSWSPPFACERDVCCSYGPGDWLGCWSAPTAWDPVRGPVGSKVWTIGPSPTPGPFVRSFRDGEGFRPDRRFRDDIRMAPLPGGGREVCLGRQLPPDHGLMAPDAIPALWCADARRLSELPPTVMSEPFRPEPDRMSADGRPARSRADWDAMCLDITPNQWRCWGMHEGWGHPPVP